MTKHPKVATKKPGRPVTTGKGRTVGVRLHPHQLADLDSFRAQFTPQVTRPEAIRRMISALSQGDD